MRFLRILAVTMTAATLFAQSSSPAVSGQTLQAEVSFQLERPGLTVPKYTITVHEDGTGT